MYYLLFILQDRKTKNKTHNKSIGYTVLIYLTVYHNLSFANGIASYSIAANFEEMKEIYYFVENLLEVSI